MYVTILMIRFSVNNNYFILLLKTYVYKKTNNSC